eukprot:1106317-Karenia_brevis.AAC.1
MEEWRQRADNYMKTIEARVATNEINVQWLIRQFEQLSSKDKNGQKGLKKAFGSKGSDLKPEKFEKEKPGMMFKSWSTS